MVGKSKWKTGNSAKALAYCWEQARGFPEEVIKAFQESSPVFKKVEFLMGFPEFHVNLPGRGSGSKNDIFVLAKSSEALITIALEGKANEPFDQLVTKKLGSKPSEGKKERLQFLCKTLELEISEVQNVHYQLLHRAASAILEALIFNAPIALVMIHSFGFGNEHNMLFNDYCEFVKLFRKTAERNRITGPAMVNGIQLYFGWVDGDNKFLNI